MVDQQVPNGAAAYVSNGLADVTRILEQPRGALAALLRCGRSCASSRPDRRRWASRSWQWPRPRGRRLDTRAPGLEQALRALGVPHRLARATAYAIDTEPGRQQLRVSSPDRPKSGRAAYRSTFVMRLRVDPDVAQGAAKGA
jgi:hypothetical protein